MTFVSAKSILNAFKAINRTRLNLHRSNVIRKTNDASRPKYQLPLSPKKVALLSVSDGWGNSLYLLGIAKRLTEHKIKVALLVRPEFLKRFSEAKFVEKIIPLGQSSTPNEIDQFNPDILVDFEYVALRHWRLRHAALSSTRCYCCCLSSLLMQSSYFDHWIQIERKCHISDRLAMVLEHITGSKETAVFPWVLVSKKEIEYIDDWIHKLGIIEERMVYLNCCASDKDRCLSYRQAKALTQSLLEKQYQIVVNATCLKNTEQQALTLLSPSVHLLPQITFRQLSALVKKVRFVITPDTSITHIASSFNIPSFVIFPPNDRDYWSKWRAADVWNGLSSITETIAEDDPNLSIDCFGYANKKVKENREYSPEFLVKKLNNFYSKLSKLQWH